MRKPSASTLSPARLGLFWLGIQVVWGALLAVSLQVRATQLAGAQALAAYGALAASGAAVAAVTQILAGLLSDRRRARGSRRVEFYLAGTLAAVPALFWFYTAGSFAQLVAALLAIQCAMNVAIGPYEAAIPDFVADGSLGTASSWMAALQSAGNALGALIAGLSRSAVLTAAAIAALLASTCAATAAHVRTLPLRPVQPGRMCIDKAFVDLFVSRALVYLGFYTLLGYLFFYVQRAVGGDAKTATAIVLLVFTIAGSAGAALSAAAANRLDRRAVAAAGGALFIGAIGAFLVARGLGSILASAAVAGIAWGVFLTGDWALGCGFLLRSALATSMGIWNLALLVPQILAPLIATAVLTAMHALRSPSAAQTAFAIAALQVLAGILWIKRLPAAMPGAVDSALGGNIP